jgi:hypothetical protein
MDKIINITKNHKHSSKILYSNLDQSIQSNNIDIFSVKIELIHLPMNLVKKTTVRFPIITAIGRGLKPLDARTDFRID